MASSRYSRIRRFCSDERRCVRGRLDDQGEERCAQHGRGGRRATEGSRRRRRRVDEDEDALGHGAGSGAALDALELRVDPARDEAQRELSQRGQVRLGEEPVERDGGPLGRVDIAVAHPLAERVRAHVDELDLVGRGQDLVGDPLVDGGAR